MRALHASGTWRGRHCLPAYGNHTSRHIGHRRSHVPPRASSAGDACAALPYSNPIGVHALVWRGGWCREDAEAAARGTAACGYDLLEIPAFNAASLDAPMTASVLSNHGLRAATSLGLTLDADISSDDATVAARGEEALKDALSFTAAIGARHMAGILYSALAKYPGPPTAAGRKNCVAALQRLAVMAEDVGVSLCLEVVNRYETNVLNTAAQAMELISEVDRPNVYVHLDTYHMNIEEVSMADAVRTCGQKLGYVHIGESHRGYLSTGSVDLEGLFNALVLDAGYTGPITFESFSSTVVSPALSNTLCVWRNLWGDSVDLATHARQHVDAQLRLAHTKEAALRGSSKQ